MAGPPARRHARHPPARAAHTRTRAHGARGARGGPPRAAAGEPADVRAGVRRVRRRLPLSRVRRRPGLHTRCANADVSRVRPTDAAARDMPWLSRTATLALRLERRAGRARGAPALSPGA